MAYRIGVRDLYHCGGTVGVAQGLDIALVCVNAAAENVGPAVFAAENGFLGKYRHTGKYSRTAGADGGICQDPVIEGDFDAVVIVVEGHRFYFDTCKKKLCAADLCAGGGVQNVLGTCS